MNSACGYLTTTSFGFLVSHLLASHVAESALVGVGVGAEQIRGNGVLEERVAEHLQALQVEAVAGVGQGQGLQDEARVGPQAFRGVSCLGSGLGDDGEVGRRCCGSIGTRCCPAAD